MSTTETTIEKPRLIIDRVRFLLHHQNPVRFLEAPNQEWLDKYKTLIGDLATAAIENPEGREERLRLMNEFLTESDISGTATIVSVVSFNSWFDSEFSRAQVSPEGYDIAYGLAERGFLIAD